MSAMSMPYIFLVSVITSCSQNLSHTTNYSVSYFSLIPLMYIFNKKYDPNILSFCLLLSVLRGIRPFFLHEIYFERGVCYGGIVSKRWFILFVVSQLWFHNTKMQFCQIKSPQLSSIIFLGLLLLLNMMGKCHMTENYNLAILGKMKLIVRRFRMLQIASVSQF